MKRNNTLEELSDGRVYEPRDLVEVSCNGCKGNASCCHGMGNSVILDPYDVYRITCGLNKSFEELLADRFELNMVDGVVLPNLRMGGEREACAFLHEKGKCSIHTIRPGVCRIFPLGRVYQDNDYKYFLQPQECKNQSKTLTKVEKWIDTPDLQENKKFILQWHYFLNEVEGFVREAQEEQIRKELIMYVLNQFYVKRYDENADFYHQFEARLQKAKELIKAKQQR